MKITSLAEVTIENKFLIYFDIPLMSRGVVEGEEHKLLIWDLHTHKNKHQMSEVWCTFIHLFICITGCGTTGSSILPILVWFWDWASVLRWMHQRRRHVLECSGCRHPRVKSWMCTVITLVFIDVLVSENKSNKHRKKRKITKVESQQRWIRVIGWWWYAVVVGHFH